jgi:hypothetical protein
MSTARTIARWVPIVVGQAKVLIDKKLWDGEIGASYHHAGFGIMLSTTKLRANDYK